jgi:N-acetylneuraminate synthase
VHIEIGGRRIGPDEPVFVIAELSGNHNGDVDRARRLVSAAADAGADAVKLQTYTADTLTIDADTRWFRLGEGTLWSNRTLHALYSEAATPWEWHEELSALATTLGLQLFSTPVDSSAVQHLEALGAPAYKVASFEIVDLELLRAVAATGKPLIISTGMSTIEEIDDALATTREAGASQVALLRCNSSYPAPVEEMDLRTIQDMTDRFGVPVGLSDHTLGDVSAITAVALGACIVEKHLTLARADGGPDAAFSLEPDELARFVDAVRSSQRALGHIRYGPSKHEEASLVFRRSVFVVADVRAGEAFTRDNLRVIRPGHGLPPKVLDDIVGRVAARDIPRGTPLDWDVIADEFI